MSRLRNAWLPLLLSGAAVLTIFGMGTAWSARSACADLERRFAEIETEADLLLEGAESREVVVGAPMVTWADLILGLHAAAAQSGLDRFSYDTAGVVALEHPTAIPRKAGDEPETPVSADEEQETEAEETKDPETLPYRALLAHARGSGRFESIVAFSAALARVEPALGLDEFTIFAEQPHPRFEARIRLVSSLPVSLEAVAPIDPAAVEEKP